MRGVRFRTALFLVATSLAGVAPSWSEAPANAADLCKSSEILSAPNRPNLASSADVTECGLLEFEQGWTGVNGSYGERDDFLNSTLRYGLGHNLDVRWGTDLLAHDSVEHGSGVADSAVAVRYRFFKQGRGIPAMALQYGTKLPSAGHGLGTGFTDHNLGFLASKDVGPVHLDYNLLHAWLGGAQGYAPYTSMVMALSSTVHGGLGAILEFSGDVQPIGCPIATFALTYKVNRRLTMDAGVNLALQPGELRNRLLLGFTYAVWKHVGSSQH
jgi:hypothetical protein